jgi:large subunit ribosomal protein L46
VQAAGRILEQSAGVNMNTWLVGNHPIGHAKLPYSEDLVKMNDAGHMEKGDMVFFMKGRIMAGQADIKKNSLGVKDFSWLAREEIRPLVSAEYWKAIERMLPER